VKTLKALNSPVFPPPFVKACPVRTTGGGRGDSIHTPPIKTKLLPFFSEEKIKKSLSQGFY
jgi:hypothetical protein